MVYPQSPFRSRLTSAVKVLLQRHKVAGVDSQPNGRVCFLEAEVISVRLIATVKWVISKQPKKG